MFGTLTLPTPMAIFLWAVWAVVQWRIAPPVTWIGRVRVDAPADPLVELHVSQQH